MDPLTHVRTAAKAGKVPCTKEDDSRLLEELKNHRREGKEGSALHQVFDSDKSGTFCEGEKQQMRRVLQKDSIKGSPLRHLDRDGDGYISKHEVQGLVDLALRKSKT